MQKINTPILLGKLKLLSCLFFVRSSHDTTELWYLTDVWAAQMVVQSVALRVVVSVVQ